MGITMEQYRELFNSKEPIDKVTAKVLKQRETLKKQEESNDEESTD